MLTIPQVAELLGLSKDTIRRRIRLGELKAEKRVGPYGPEWVLSDDQFDQARTIHDVVEVTRSVSIGELQRTMREAIEEVVSNSVRAETEELRQILVDQREFYERRIAELESKLLLQLEAQNEQKKKSLWQRLFE